MKHNKSIIAIAFLMLLSFAQANANAGSTFDSSKTLPVELKLVGTVRNQPLVQIDFSGTKDENEFTISITDENGVIWYSGVAKGEKFSKQFLLNSDELGDAVLRFEITGKRSGRTVAYQVSSQQKVINQMDVVKL